MFFHVFPGTAPGPPFFSFFPEFDRKSVILDPPWRPARPPNGGPNLSNGGENTQKSISRCHFLRVLERTCFQYRPLTLPSVIFYGFWTDLGVVFQFSPRFCEPNFARTENFLNTKREATSQPRTRHDQTRLNKIKQDQPNDRQA